MDAVCVYCGASAGNDPFFAEVARDFGRAVAGRGMRLVYGGGSAYQARLLAAACGRDSRLTITKLTAPTARL